ncbi:MAG TPA: hypothetical protein ENI29_04300 [bacterium]|nr:hypothetical protein [bacterium]
MVNKIEAISKPNLLLSISVVILVINFILILFFANFDRLVYMIFFYHVSSAWLSYFSFGISLICNVLYLRNKKIKFSYLGKNSIIVGLIFSGFTLITGSLWYNATSAFYTNVFWQWSEPRQTMTLVLFFSYLSFLIFRNLVEDKEKKAKLSAALGIVVFPTVPLSYISVIIFTSTHPLINPNPGQGNIYWDPLKLFVLFFNLIAITLLFFYVVQKLVRIDETKEKLDRIIQERLIEEEI